MRRLGSLAFVVALIVGCVWHGAGAQTSSASTATTAAQTADRSWLQLIDAGKYREGWSSAAALLQSAISAESFAKTLAAARDPLGAVESRTLASATVTRTLPGAPDGDYIVCVYDTKFANKAAARETVTASREKDGTWRVSGYYIK